MTKSKKKEIQEEYLKIKSSSDQVLINLARRYNISLQELIEIINL